MNHQTTLATSIGSGGVAAAIVGIAVWILASLHISVPADVAADFGIIIMAAAHYLVTLKLLPAPKSDTATPSPTTETTKAN